MALFGDYYVANYEGQTIEFLRNNWNKTLKLLIDGEEAARASCMFPGRLTLTTSLEHDGVQHAVVAKSIPYRLVWSKETLEIDGRDTPLGYGKPHGVFEAMLRDAWKSDLAIRIAVGAIALAHVVLVVAVVGFVLTR